MLRWVYLLLASLLVGLGSLNAVWAPAWTGWKLAVLAAGYGHWLALAALLLAALAWLGREQHLLVALATVLLAAVAFGLLLKPTLEAARLAADLPERLERAFGPSEVKRAPFSLRGFVAPEEGEIAVETRAFSEGLPLDLYRPSNYTGPALPVVIMVHGGGWDGGDRTEMVHFNRWLAGRGYAVAAIDYRLAPQHIWPAQRDDLLAAIGYLKTHAHEFGIDATRLVLLGRSAGGQIAETVAYTAADPAIRGVAALYAPADMEFAYSFGTEDDILKSPLLLRQFLGGPPTTALENYRAASSYFQVTRSVSPTLLVHGQLDTLVWHRQSERLAARLAEHGVPHVFVSVPWTTHALEYNLASPAGQLTTYALEWFLAAVTRSAPAPLSVEPSENNPSKTP